MASDLYIAFGADTGEMEAGLARARRRPCAPPPPKCAPSPRRWSRPARRPTARWARASPSLGSKLSEAKESVASFKDEGRTPSKVVAALPLAPRS